MLASTEKVNVGSALREMAASASARKLMLKLPLASASAVPLAISVDLPQGMNERQYLPHHHGMRASRLTVQWTCAPSRGTPA